VSEDRSEDSLLPSPGAVMKDGSIFVGVSTNGKALLVAPQDAGDAGQKLKLHFKEACAYIEGINTEAYLGHSNWRLPSKDELILIHKNKETIAPDDLASLNYPGDSLSSTGLAPWGIRCRLASINGRISGNREELLEAPFRCVREDNWTFKDTRQYEIERRRREEQERLERETVAARQELLRTQAPQLIIKRRRKSYG
jgi:hypothetical protein